MEQQEYFEKVDQAYGTLKGADLEETLKQLTLQAGREFGTGSLFYAAMLSELGGYYRGQRRYDESEAYFKSALEILEREIGQDDPNYATAVNNLAGTHRMMKKFDDAEKEFSKCLEIYEKLLGKNHILYASGLNNLSLLCLDKGDLPRASELLAQTVEILAQQPECVDEYTTSLCNLGALQRSLGQLEQSAENLKKAVQLYETVLGTGTPHYHAALNSLGLTYYSAKNFEESVKWLEQSRAAAENLYGPDHRETKAVAEHLALVQKAWEESK